MELFVALSLLLLPIIAFVAVRGAAKLRRKKILAERERQRRRKPKVNPSARSEMRAYDDPSGLAGDITTLGSAPTTDR